MNDAVNDAVNDATDDEIRELLGAYVLGGLEPDERARVEQHLPTCAACRSELEQIMPAADALRDLRESRPPGQAPGRVAGPASSPGPSAPVAMGERVVASVDDLRRRELRSRWTRTVAGAVVAAAVVGVVVVGGLRLTDPAPTAAPTAGAVPLEPVRVSERTAAISASAELVAHTWGIEVKLQATGFRPGQRYLVSVQGADGQAYPAGGFVGTGSRELDCNLSSSVLRASARGFVVRDTAGDVLVTSEF